MRTRPTNTTDKVPHILFDGRWLRPDKPDGITRYSTELVKALLEKGTSVSIAVIDASQAEGLNVDKLVVLPKPNNLFASRRGLGKALREGDYDLYFCPHFLQILPNTETPTVLTCHDLTPWKFPASGSSIAWKVFHKNLLGLKLLLTRAKFVATVSETSKKELESLLPDSDIRVVYNGISEDFYRIKSKPTKKQLVYIGRYEAYKNVETLISAVKDLPDYRLVCIGAISETTKLRLAADRIKFVGPVDDVKYKVILSESHALVMPSRSEGFGLPVVEAMAAGLPVVCSDLPVFHEIGGDSLLYVPSDDVASYVLAVRELEQSEFRKKKVREARARARRLSWDKSADVLLRLCTMDK